MDIVCEQNHTILPILGEVGLSELFANKGVLSVGVSLSITSYQENLPKLGLVNFGVFYRPTRKIHSGKIRLLIIAMSLSSCDN